MRVTLEIKDGRLYLPYQDEVEALALETMGTHHKIYFEPIPIRLGDKCKLYIMYAKDLGGWEVRRNE